MKTKIFNLFTILFLMSCSRNINDLREYKAQSEFVKQNFEEYNKVYVELTRTVQDHIDRRFEEMKGQIGHEYQINNLIIFNSKKNKLFTTLNTNYKEYKGSNDLIRALYGVKINNKWHIYLGAICIAFREGYKYERYEPFTWEELSYVAHDNFFRRYIDVDRKGNLIINHELIESDITPRKLGGTNYITEKTEEENFIKLTQYFESRKIDDVEYQRLLDEVNNPEPQKRWPIQKVTWWQRLMGEEVPIFETKEWKEYIKIKNTSHESK